MNVWQIANQAQYLLQTRVWPGTSTPVFMPESVVVVAGESDIDALDATLVLPMAVITPGGGPSDPQAGDEPGYLVQEISIVIATRNFGDRLGQAAVMGANRESVSDSRGRGVLEIEPQLLATLELLNVQEGVTVALKSQSSLTTRKDQQDNVYSLKEYSFEVSCTSALFYPPARRFHAVGSTSEVELTWSLPSSRYDRYRMVLRRASGSTPPTSITDGTSVALSSNLATSKTETLAAGTYSYALFAVYDDFSRGANNVAAPATDLRVSDSVTDTVVVS